MVHISGIIIPIMAGLAEKYRQQHGEYPPGFESGASTSRARPPVEEEKWQVPNLRMDILELQTR